MRILDTDDFGAVVRKRRKELGYTQAELASYCGCATVVRHPSLAGSQAKIALHRSSDGKWFEPSGLAPSTHILKPAGTRFSDSAVNECLCALAAGRLGLDVPKVELMDVDGPIICTERFDRDLSNSVRAVDGLPVPARLHQEGCCQALGIVPERKYEEGGS